MKPARFSYQPARSIDEAVAALAAWAPQGGRILAGGQSLLPMMAFRLAQPAHLIDINRIPGLDRVACADGVLRIPACVRHAAFERPAVPGPLGAMLATVAAHIAHHPIRTRGTFCGSIAHADPASEWCALAVLLDARMVAHSAQGERVLEAGRFFVSAMTTALRDDEMLTEIVLKLPPPDTRYGFCEHSRRAGDYAQAMTLVGCRVTDGVMRDVRLAVGGAEDRPRRLVAVEALLENAAADRAGIRRAADAAADSIDPMQDAQVPTSLRRDLLRATTQRALRHALA